MHRTAKRALLTLATGAANLVCGVLGVPHVTSTEVVKEYHYNEPKKDLIEPRDTPFRQTLEDWERTGISLTMHGEPKSGTTWLAGLIVELCLRLCGNADNTWCSVGRVEMSDQQPPKYQFEMLHAETGKLFLHFRPCGKHTIPGFDVKESCRRRGRVHSNGFDMESPCSGITGALTHDGLVACLPDTSPDCLRYLPSTNPNVRRMIVVFRDPRDVIVSEHRMKIDFFNEDVGELEPYIRSRFENIVGWTHQRWVWHKNFLRPISHVVFHEDLQASAAPLVDLAAFMGLACSPADANAVWERPVSPTFHGSYTSYGLPDETLEWMNGTISRIMPDEFLNRYGLVRNATYLGNP